MEFSYNWQEALLSIVLVLALTEAGKFLIFKIPALGRTRDTDSEQNQNKMKNKKKYKERISLNQKVGLSISLVFYIAVLPWIVTLEAQPWNKMLLDVFLILMVYDLFYYLMHRFLFHGQGYFRRVHAIHHQARSRVSSADSFLLNPTEITLGVVLFYLVTVSLTSLLGSAFHVTTIVIVIIVYTQINTINHCRIDLKGFPWKTINWIAMKHDAHHLDMHKGNFATITLFYDWLFGTLETHPREKNDAPSVDD